MKTIYIIDACALIDAAKDYNMSKKTFRPIWEVINSLIENDELFTSSEILDEIKDDDLLTWAKQHKKFFVPLTKEIQYYTIDILKKYPTFIKIKSTNNSNGDPFLVATAIVKNGCIVTNERSGDEKNGDYRIPNICKKFGIEYIDLHSFLNRFIN